MRGVSDVDVIPSISFNDGEKCRLTKGKVMGLEILRQYFAMIISVTSGYKATTIMLYYNYNSYFESSI